MRTAIYARFSTELQQERSIEDQFELCRAYAAKNGLDVVGTSPAHRFLAAMA